ncbi:MAG: hypothetical protein ACPL1K_04025, partial [Candidatus Kryptoniota bacterium]
NVMKHILSFSCVQVALYVQSTDQRPEASDRMIQKTAVLRILMPARISIEDFFALKRYDPQSTYHSQSLKGTIQ